MFKLSNLDKIVPSEIMEMLSPEAVQIVLGNIADAVRAEWIRLGSKEVANPLDTQDYLAGIQPVKLAPGRATITLLGETPNRLEQGAPVQRMHETHLGPNVPVVPVGERGKHESKDGGFYRSVPFRHATPGTAGLVGAPMGSSYSGHDAVADSKKLGREIYKAAKALKGSTSTPYGQKGSYGGKLPEGMVAKLKPYHATDIYAGMHRFEKTYEKATQSKYLTFRTIAVDASGQPVGSSPWIRKAIPGLNLATKVRDFANEIAADSFEAYVKGLK